ncbi:MAG: hypothetical protein RL708_2093 [Bacteroidota bacterium]|jgi:uncharacterized protein YdeI (YjbR/CyaY-like superfamily)
MKPTFFAQQNQFRKWLEKNHSTEKELVVGFYKVGSGKQSMKWSESVDQALCFGWIDGVRKSVDEQSYCIRFTPRKSSSIWSAVNINKVAALTKQGLMQKAGIDIFNKRTESKSKVYAFEQEEVKFSASFEIQFNANKKAWNYFQLLAPSYQKLSIHWVMSAKQESTQIKRLTQLITESEAGINQWKNSKYSKK